MAFLGSMTLEEFDKLRAELQELEVETDRIRDARQSGEGSELESARAEQAQLEGRMEALYNACVVGPKEQAQLEGGIEALRDLLHKVSIIPSGSESRLIKSKSLERERMKGIAEVGQALLGTDEAVLTSDGNVKLAAELEKLEAERKRVTDRIREAGEFGEKSERDAAMTEQAQLEGLIKALQDRLCNAVIVEHAGQDGRVSVGSRVRLRDAVSGEETEYHIVGGLEADPAEHRISNRSPLAEAVMGHAADETLWVQTPGGPRTYLIVSVGE